MHFAFAIMSLFPGGGLQRDCVDIARRVQQRGHAVTIFTSRNAGGIADDLSVRILPVTGYTNHGRQRSFSEAFTKAAARRFDLLVGFDKLGGLDLLYCSDRSMRARASRNPLLHHELGVADRIKWLGHHEDVPELMAAADVFVHPARYDTTGTVILEAIVNGLPVITTSNCGYAKHVTGANAGIVVQDPFRAQTFVAALAIARDPACRQRWSGSGREYGKQSSLYEGRARATELIVASGFKHAADERGGVYHKASIGPAAVGAAAR
jgi:Glycosyl transferases group 1